MAGPTTNLLLMGTMLALLFFIAPLLRNRPQLVTLDDMRNWGLKGGGRSTLPSSMLGVYFLSGNMMPWSDNNNRCGSAEEKNSTLCRNGWKRSPVFLIDTSRSYYHQSTGTIQMYASALGISEYAVQGGGMWRAYLLQLLRVGYTVSKDDVEFEGRRNEYFEGKMWVSQLGLSATTIVGKGYRSTVEDSRRDGSLITRYFWKDVDESMPQHKKHAFKEFSYEMKRVMDSKGNINRGVLREMKKLFGDRVIMPL